MSTDILPETTQEVKPGIDGSAVNPAPGRTRLQWACWMAAKGITTFIVEVNSKRPIGGHSWYVRNTQDPEQLAEWFEESPDCNWAAHPGREYVVIDLDVKHAPDGPSGIEAFEAICKENDIDDFLLEMDTLIVRTPSGGYHLYFKTPRPCANRHTFPAKIDVRGAVGYVVGPGSKIDAGEWIVEDENAPIMDIPDFLLEYLESPGQKDPNHEVPLIDLDLAENIQLAMTFLRNEKPAIEGDNGDQHTYDVCCYLRDFGISEAEALRVMFESGWNKRCDPPWDASHLEVKIKNSYEYGQNRPGCKSETLRVERLEKRPGADDAKMESMLHAKTAAELEYLRNQTITVDGNVYTVTAWEREQGIPPDEGDGPAVGTEPSHEYTWLNAGDLAMDTFPPNEYLFWNHVMLRQVNPILGAPDIGKTTIGMHMCAAAGAGCDLWGHQVRQMPVLMVLYEDMTSVIQTRMLEICEDLGETLADLPIQTLYVEKEEEDTALAYVREDGQVAYAPFYQALEAKLREIGEPCLLMLDTLMEAVTFNENIKAASSAALKAVLRGICRKYDATIITTRHPSRRAIKEGTYDPGDVANQGDVRMTLIVEANGTDRVLFRQGKFNFGRKDAPLKLKRVGNVFKVDDTIKAASLGKLSEEAAHVLDAVEEARRLNYTVAFTSGGAVYNSKAIAATLKENHGLDLKTGQVKRHMIDLIREGWLHRVGGVRGGKNFKPATIEIGPEPAPAPYQDHSTLLGAFNRVLDKHEGDEGLLDQHMAHAMVSDIFWSIQEKIENKKKRLKRLGYQTERELITEVKAWLRKSALTDLEEYAQGNDDGSLNFSKISD